MNSKTIILLGIIATFSLLFFVAISVGFGSNNYLFQDGSYPFTGNQNASGYYVLEYEEQYWLHIDLDQGVTDVSINAIPSGVHTQDQHFTMLMVSVNTAPGDGKTLNVTLSNGVNSMEVTLTGDTLFNNTVLGAFDLDVSAQNFELVYSQTAGGYSTHCCVMIHWYYKENE